MRYDLRGSFGRRAETLAKLNRRQPLVVVGVAGCRLLLQQPVKACNIAQRQERVELDRLIGRRSVCDRADRGSGLRRQRNRRRGAE